MLVAGFLLFSGLVSLSDGIRDDFPQRGANFWFCLFVADGLLVLLIGGGSLANIANRRFDPVPTLTVIAGYCLTVVLLPSPSGALCC